VSKNPTREHYSAYHLWFVRTLWLACGLRMLPPAEAVRLLARTPESPISHGMGEKDAPGCREPGRSCISHHRPCASDRTNCPRETTLCSQRLTPASRWCALIARVGGEGRSEGGSQARYQPLTRPEASISRTRRVHYSMEKCSGPRCGVHSSQSRWSERCETGADATSSPQAVPWPSQAHLFGLTDSSRHRVARSVLKPRLNCVGTFSNVPRSEHCIRHHS
jgi:hypothetical protein